MRSEQLDPTAGDETGGWLCPAVHLLAGELRAHHQPTGPRSHRLARSARRVADRLGLDPMAATEAELVAILHHAGRLAVPGGLLAAPRLLTAPERDIVRGRTIAGADLLARRAGLDDLAGIVRHVHERWDGSGHPYGLAGEDIPMPARIVAVVDAHHLLTGGGGGRSPLTPHEACLRLAVEAGWRFDPTVVRAWFDELREQSEGRSRPAAPNVPSPPALL
jgi:two-component system response regulator RpfG